MIIGLGLTLIPFSIDLRSVQNLSSPVCGTALNKSSFVQHTLANRPILFIGRISYSVYILQQPFFNHSENPVLNLPIVEALKVVLVLVLAYLSYTFLEKPFIRYARTTLERRSRARLSEGLPA